MQSSLYHSILVRITTVKRIFQAKLNLLEQLKIVAHNNFHRKKVRERLLVKAYLQAEELASHSKRFSFESILKKAPIWIQNEMNRQEKKRKRHFKSISKSTRILLPTSILSKFKIQEFFHLAISLEKTFEKIVLIPILIIALVLEKLGFRVFEKRLVRFLSKGFRLWITVICYLAVFQSLRAVDFDDLKETSPGFFGREKIYGSEKEKRYAIDGFFIEWERWPRTNPTHSSFHLFWFLNQVNYPKYQRSQLFPLYLSESSKVDQRYEANHLLLSNYSKEKDGSYAYRLFPFLWFGNGAGKSHHGVFPLYYKSKMDTANQKEDFLVMPFYFGSSESTSDEEKTFSLSPLHFNSNTKAKQISENRFFAPIVPLYYSYSDEAKIQRNYLGFIDTEKDKKSDSISRVWVMPVFYWREKSYLNVFPLFFRNVAEDEKSGAWYGLAPPVYYSYSPLHSTFYLLNYYSTSNQTKEKSETFTAFAPFYFQTSDNTGYSQILIPGLYYSETNADKSTHKNITLLYDHIYDKKEKLDRLFIAPFLFYKKDSYLNIAPFYFSSLSKSEEYRNWYSFIPPIYYSRSPTEKIFYILNYYSSSISIDKNSSDFTTIAPVYFNWSNNKGYNETIVPFIYYSKTKEDSSSYKNVFLIYSQVNDHRGKLNQILVSPIFFYKRDSYFHFAPLYWNWRSDEYDETSKITQADNYLLFPFFYHESKKRASYTNILGLVSREYDHKGKLAGSMFAPFYFYKKDSYEIIFPFLLKKGMDNTDKKGTQMGLFYYNDWNSDEETLLAGNYYSHKDIKDNSYFRTLFPIYYEWKNKKWSGEVTPFYLTLDFPNRDRFHLNASGYSYSLNVGTIESDKKLGKFHRYVDADYSWLGYAVRISTRTTFDFLEEGQAKETVDTLDITPSLSKKKSFTRENSKQFYGVNLLFGLYGWEMGDTKRHIRAFPLTWLTWDTRSNDKVITAPPIFVHYSSEDLRYTVLFPFYGNQKTKESERTSIALIGYIDEEIQDKNIKEKSILWPLINWHSSDLKTSSRFIPFYWHRKQKEEIGLVTNFITPFFYHNQTVEKNGNEVANTFSPLWFRFESKDQKDSLRQHFTIPIYYYRENISSVDRSELFLSLPYNSYTEIDGTSKKPIRKTIVILPTYYNKEYAKTANDTENTKFYSPLYIYNGESNQASKKEDFSWFLPIPFLYHSYETDNDRTYWNWLAFVGYEDAKTFNHARVFPLYSHAISKDITGSVTNVTRWIFPTYYEKNYAKTPNQTETTKFYSPLYIYNGESNQVSKKEDFSWFLPIPFLYHSYETANERNYWNWLGFAGYEDTKTFNHARVFPLYSHAISKDKTGSVTNVTRWIFPTYYEKNYAKTANDTENTKFYSPLYIYNGESNQASKKEDFSWFLPIPFLYHSYETDNDRTYWNWLAFVGYEDAKTFNHARVFPLYSHAISKDVTGSVTSVTRWILPTYYEKNYAKTSNDTENIKFYSPLYIYNRESNQASKKEDFSWFLPIPFLYHSYETDNDRTYWNWLAFVGYEDAKTFNHARVFPLYSHAISKDKTGS
ncbi:MAG TPA: hypothetical protein PKN83_02090, partial [Leptospiraceae bacterium]|nr:hypothetical protein [Leptospiraceae bacterium]HNK58757.1 hypothetical protein [Leptospiraceae bacterium]HNM87421.1 hypothetical protein [Leptospiraceae bacterium]